MDDEEKTCEKCGKPYSVPAYADFHEWLAMKNGFCSYFCQHGHPLVEEIDPRAAAGMEEYRRELEAQRAAQDIQR